MSKDKDKIKVTDKRKFDADGTPRDPAAEEPEPEKADAGAAAQDAPEPEPEQLGDDEPKEDAEPLGEGEAGEIEIDFKTFIISLGTQAMMFLGFVPDPVSKELEVSLPQAKQMIDIIAILQQKTEGNLDDDEAQLLESLLFDLRMQYVERGKKS